MFDLLYVILLIIFLLVTCVAIVVLGYEVISSILTMLVFKGGFFAKTSDERIKSILALMPRSKKLKIVDLGSGDAEILIALAKKGYSSTGYEIDPVLVRSSRKRVAKLGLEKQITIELRDLWKVDLRTFDVVIVYGIPYMMKKLSAKLKAEMKNGSRVIAVYFPIPGLKASKKHGQVSLYEF